MFNICVESNFEASHQLVLQDGSKEALHRHDWQVSVEVSGEQLNSIGLVMDFHRLKELVEAIVAGFDGVRLEDTKPFQQNNSSAENVSKYIYEMLEPKLPGGVRLEGVKVVEEPGCWAKFVK